LCAGTVLQNRYRIVRQLGKGGMGAVYEAIDLRLGSPVALKQTLTQAKPLWTQFAREARLLAQLNHPALPRVSDYFIEDERAFFVMQFVEGIDLAAMLTQHGLFPRGTVIAWADQILDALIYLHSRDRRIIHRDIKPHNLKVTAAGKIALLDFGLAKSHAVGRESETEGQGIFGYSPQYAPLEQIQNNGTGPHSDIYALGATLYHLLTGVKPADALTRARALVSSQPNPLTPAHEVNEAVGPELSLILSRAMAHEPRERFRSAGEFREALRRLGRIDDPAGIAYDQEYRVDLYDGRDMNSRFGARAITVLLMILLGAFGIFCRYYPWRTPDTTVSEMAVPGDSQASVESKSDNFQPREADRARSRTGKRRATVRSRFRR
jgi:serine/threonine protein kinase